MFKNYLYSMVLLTICLKTVTCISCFQCGTSVYECKNKNNVKRVKCGNDFDNCANIVKFYRNGTTIIYSSFCYGQVKNNKECKEDIGFKDGQTCKITCTNDFCNPIVNEDLESPYKVIPNYELLEISSTVKSPSQNYSERKNSSFLKCYSINLIIITLLINFLYHKIRI